MLAAFATVERKFAGGEWDRAASECNRVIDEAGSDRDIKERARLLQTAIPNFGRAYDEGLKKFRQGALSQSAKPLRQALELYGKMRLTRNKYQGELETKLGDASLAAGREALVRDDLVTAFQSFRDAARFDPADAKARDGLANVEGKAQELFQLAYSQKDQDPTGALKKFRVVVQATDPSALVHEKAKNHIAAMAP
jgi:tetratricopeptide (TPR) repeat protein